MRSTIRLAVAFALVLSVSTFASLAAKKKEETGSKTYDPISIKATGTILECTDYIVFGRTPDTHRDIMVKNINAGLPICFVSDVDKEVYLLVEPSFPALSRIQPLENFLGNGVMLDGVVYQKGSLKAVTINEIGRTGAYTDRESRRAKNPEPTRNDKKTPGAKKDPSLP